MRRILQNCFVKWLLAPVAVIFAIGWGYFEINYPTCTFRYKLTAEVQTPDGVKSGSSVVEVSYTTQSVPLSQGGRFDSLLGEATYVDLGDGKNLFVTLGTLDSAQPVQHWQSPDMNSPLIEPSEYEKMKGALDPIWLPIKIFRLGRTPGNEREMCLRVAKLYGQPAEAIPLDNLPTLVTFSELNQPATAKTVNPNDLISIFGLAHSVAVKIEVLNAPISDRIKDILPWVPNQTTGKDGRTPNRLAWWEFYKFSQPAERSYILQKN